MPLRYALWYGAIQRQEYLRSQTGHTNKIIKVPEGSEAEAFERSPTPDLDHALERPKEASNNLAGAQASLAQRCSQEDAYFQSLRADED